MSDQNVSSVQLLATVPDPAGPEDVAVLLDRVRAIEAARILDSHFFFPRYHWYHADTGCAPSAVTAADTLFHEAGAASRHADQVTAAAILFRFADEPEPFIQTLSDTWTPEWLEALPPDLGVELCILLYFQRHWAQLEQTACRLLQGRTVPPFWAAYLADFHFFAVLQPLQPARKAGRLTSQDVSRLEEALSLNRRAVPGMRKNLLIHTGVLAAMRGDVTESQNVLAAARRESGRTTHFFRSVEHVLSTDEMTVLCGEAETADALDKAGTYPWLDLRLRHAPDGPVFLVSCDRAYMDGFIDGYLASVAQRSPDTLVHLHALGFDPSESRLRDLEDRHGVGLNLTVDRFSPLPDGGDGLKGYAVCSRFMYMPLYLRHYDLVTVTDIDGAILEPLRDVWAGHERSTLMLSPYLRADRSAYPPVWGSVTGGVVGFTADDGAALFVRTLALYLRRRVDACVTRGEKLFYADQAGLGLAYLALKDRCPFARMFPGLFRQGGEMRPRQRWRGKQSAQEALLRDRLGLE